MTKRSEMSTLTATPRSYARQGGQPRKRVNPWWQNTRAITVSAVVLGVGLLTAGGVWLWKNGVLPQVAEQAKWQLVSTSADLGLKVDEVLVTGRVETSREALLDAVRVVRGAPILGFDPQELKERVEALPWVKTATVQRLLPDTIVVQIVERPPLALWQHDGKFSLIDHEGAVIKNVDISRFSDLLIVVGEDAPPHASSLIQMIGTQPSLMPLVKAGVWVGGRRWTLQLTNGIDVHLPEDKPAEAWAQLADYERDHKLLARDVETLDMRLPGRLIVRKANEVSPARPTATKRAGQQT